MLGLMSLAPITAQTNAHDSLNNRLSTIASYSIALSHDKTTHLLFPSSIIYTDLGSESIMASKVEAANHVLRIKASVINFKNDSNFSVMTKDGKFYNFDVYYSDYPKSFSYDLRNAKNYNLAGRQQLVKNNSGDITSEIAENLLDYTYKKNEHRIKHIRSKSYGIQLLLKNIYVYQDHFIFSLEIKNSSNISYNIDFTSFRIVDKKKAKQSAIQEQLLAPLESYDATQKIRSQTKDRSLFLFNQFTLSQDKILLIDVFEKNGGRHQTIKITNKDLINAQPIIDFNHTKTGN